MSTEQLLSANEVADTMGVAPSTLARWRQTREPDIPFSRINGRIRYRRSDIEAFLAEVEEDNDEDTDQDEDEDEEDESNDVAEELDEDEE